MVDLAAKLLEHWGDGPEELAAELNTFSETAQVLSSEQKNLIGKHPLHWVCVYDGKIAASAKTLTLLMGKMGEQGIPANNAIVRFIDKNQSTFIL